MDLNANSNMNGAINTYDIRSMSLSSILTERYISRRERHTYAPLGMVPLRYLPSVEIDGNDPFINIIGGNFGKEPGESITTPYTPAIVIRQDKINLLGVPYKEFEEDRIIFPAIRIPLQ